MSDGGERGRGHGGGGVVFVLAVGLTVAVYVGSYFALSAPIATHYGDPRIVYKTNRQRFRYGGNGAELIFWPLTRIDQWVRPGYWRGPVVDDSPDPAAATSN